MAFFYVSRIILLYIYPWWRGLPHSRQAKVSIHCRGGMLPPGYIHKYTFRSVIGRIQSAPTVDNGITGNVNGGV
jgi:hypothetical protein